VESLLMTVVESVVLGLVHVYSYLERSFLAAGVLPVSYSWLAGQ
jgi:hypothetical protein